MAVTAKVVDIDGTVFGTLSDAARVGPVASELNAPGSVTITIPTTHADALLMLPGREVQILDGTDIVFWGPIVRPQAGLVESTWQCQSLLWYFQRRFFGTADRVNLILNGGFEDDEDNWTFHDGVSHSVETDPTYVLEGAQSSELNGTTADHVQHAMQVYTHVTQYHPLGDAVTVSVWVNVPSAGYLGGAFDDWGLLARHLVAGAVVDAKFEVIDDDTPQDQWFQLEVVLPGVKAGDTVEVRLYPPHGTAFYDDVTVTLMESLAFGGTEVGEIIEGIVDYAQDNGPFTHGKSDLNITADADTTTKFVVRTYLFSEHRNIAEAILEFAGQGVVDIDFELTPTTRTLRAYFPGKGDVFATPLVFDTNLAGFSWSWDGDRAASSVVTLGPGDGPDRPEGGAVDPTFLDGLSLEIVESAADDVTIGELDNQAKETLSVAARPEILEVTTLPGTGIIGNLFVGDYVTVTIQHGWLDIDEAAYRVTRIESDHLMDQAKLTLNPVAL